MYTVHIHLQWKTYFVTNKSVCHKMLSSLLFFRILKCVIAGLRTYFFLHWLLSGIAVYVFILKKVYLVHVQYLPKGADKHIFLEKI